MTGWRAIRIFYLLKRVSCLFCPLQEEEVGNTIDSETRRKHFYQIEKSLVVSAILKLSFLHLANFRKQRVDVWIAGS